MTNKKDLTAAVIGAGRMGRRHMQVVRDAGMRLVGVVDVSGEALAAARDEHGLPENALFSSVGDLYNAVAPQCVIIATTADSHCELTRISAEHGVRHILVEKPLAVSMEQCDSMIASCEKFGAQLAVNHQMRFMEQYARPKALLASLAYGGFKSMTVVGGNFGMAMNGTHYIEAFRFMAEEEPVEVTAWFSPDIVANPRGARFEDRAGSLRVVTGSGKRLYMEIGSDQGHGLQVIYAGRNGIIGVNELSGDISTAVREEEYRALPTTRYGMPAHVALDQVAPTAVIEPTSRVLDALLTGRESVTAQDGRSAVRVLVAAYQSAENGSVAVRLDGNLDRTRVFRWA